MSEQFVINKAELDELKLSLGKGQEILDAVTPAGQPDAVSVTIRKNREDATQVWYDIVLQHDGQAGEIVGAQFFIKYRGLTMDKIFAGSNPADGMPTFPILLFKVSREDGSDIAVGVQSGAVGAKEGTHIMARLKMNKTEPLPQIWWDMEHQPPNRMTTRESIPVSAAWIV